jgi:CRP/FNR family transcriptional regulator, anaerobic regulatory protein
MKKPVALAPHRAPPLRAIPFLKAAAETETRLLSERQREQLTHIGIRLRLPARMVVYREGSPAESVFAVVNGVVKSYRDLPSGKRSVGAFLFARDLFGLAENGRYLNSTQTVTGVTLYRLPLEELTTLLKHDPDMQFQFLVKVTHELRESQRRAILINRRDAAGRLAMFVALMGKRMDEAGKGTRIVPLPMTRSDIAGFLGLSLESVIRAAADLEHRGLMAFEGRHFARITDPTGLARLVAAV